MKKPQLISRSPASTAGERIQFFYSTLFPSPSDPARCKWLSLIHILFNTLIFNSKTPVFATYLRSLSSNEQMIASYGVFAAMALVYMLPVIVFFLISQRSLMEGNIASGKGV